MGVSEPIPQIDMDEVRDRIYDDIEDAEDTLHIPDRYRPHRPDGHIHWPNSRKFELV